MKNTLFTLPLLLLTFLAFAQNSERSTFISINPGVAIYGSGILARNEIELGHTFHRYFSASAVLGFESNLSVNSDFVGSSYDISANGYFTPLNSNNKTTLKIGGGIGFGKFSRTYNGIGPVYGLNGNYPMKIQNQTQGPLANITLEGTRRISSRLELGVKYTYRIFDYDSQIPVLLKLQVRL